MHCHHHSKVLLAYTVLLLYSINKYTVLQAQAFYMYEDVPDSDEELSIGHGSPSDLSAASSQAGSARSHASSADISSAEVASRPSPGDAEGDGASPAAEINVAASKHAAAQQPDNTDSHHETRLAASMINVTHMPGVPSGSSPSSSAAGKQLEADMPPNGSCLIGHSRQEGNGTDLERAGTSPADQGEQLSDPQAPFKPHLATNKAAEMPGAPSASASASANQVFQAGGVSEEPRKRKAATVFDQGIADQAEAADLDAGIAAGAADDMDVNASMPANRLPGDAGNIADKVSADVSDDAQVSMSTRQTRRTQPRLAPWR